MPRLLTFCLLTLALLVAGGTATAATTITGGTIIDQTWTVAGSPYLIEGDITVPVDSTLTIGPGVEVQAAGNSDAQGAGTSTTRVEILIEGTLAVNGTIGSPVTMRASVATAGAWSGLIAGTAANVSLTHLRIESAINGLESRTTGSLTTDHVTIDGAVSRGLWLRAGSPTLDTVTVSNVADIGIRVEGDASPTLTRCVVRSSGNYGVAIAHSSAGRSVTLDRCTLDDNGTFGVYSDAGPAVPAAITITSSIITNHGWGVYRNDTATYAVSDSNVWNNTAGSFFNLAPGAAVIAANPLYVSATDLRLTSNSPSRFTGAGGVDQGGLPYDTVATTGLVGTLWTNTTLTAAGSPYTAPGDLTVAPGVTLTLEPGVTLQFQGSSDQMIAGANTARGELIVAGTLSADGTRAAPITLTSTQATAGTWYGLDLTTATSSLVDEVIVRHATNGLVYRTTGAGNTVAHVTVDDALSRGFWLRAGSPTLDGLVATNVSGAGIWIDAAASPLVRSCVIRDSSYGVVINHTSAGHTVTLANCTLHHNGMYGVYSAASAGNQATITITNAIISGHSWGVYRTDAATYAVSYSNMWNNSVADFFGGADGGAGMISANPQYVSSTDLHLQGGSAAIDVGTTGGPLTDADGVTRPLDGDGTGGEQWDLGAYEYVFAIQCGNGAVEAGETCDSGASNGMYGACNATCTGFGPRCGDGEINGTEPCDDANADNTDACLTTCLSATCGDGFVRAGTEACDDGNASNTDACTVTCAAASCGDGFVQAGTEACDDGNANSTDACLATCVAAACGDGFVFAGTETCDDGNLLDGDACVSTCAAATCGDGFVQAGVEECDDGNLAPGDGCGPGCSAELTPPDAGPGGPDGGVDPAPAGGGCCETSGRSTAGSLLLTALVLLRVRRRRPAR